MKLKKRKRTRRVPPYTYLGCPLTHNLTARCFRMCTPKSNGLGRCGRLAPHSMRSRIQQAIDTYKRKHL